MENRSESVDILGRSPTRIGVEVTLAILMCLVSLLGNSLVVYVINKDSRLNNITINFIHNLALTDISMATLQMPFWIGSIYTGTWNFSRELCELSAVIIATLTMVSIMTMGLIALNRYMRVVKPALYSKLLESRRSARMYCALVWLIAVFLATPPLYGWGRFSYHTKFFVCTVSWEIEHISYIIVLVGVVVNGVTIAIFYFYYKIYKAVTESTQIMNAHADKNAVGASNVLRTDIKLLKTSFTVVCFFLMAYGPVSIVVIIETLGGDIPREFFAAAVFLMFSSSLANPIIYGIMNPQFELAFKKALSCGRHGNDNVSQSYTARGIRPKSNGVIID